MIMRPGQALLLPAKPSFIWGSLVAAMALNMLANMGVWGRSAWVPDLLALGLVFWNVHQPRRIGIGIAFAFGLAMDVHQGALLGQRALAYAMLSYFAITVHRRLLWFPVRVQALHVLPLFVVARAAELLARLATGGEFPGWGLLLAPLIEAALWPLATAVLLAPQRGAHDLDENRPL